MTTNVDGSFFLEKRVSLTPEAGGVDSSELSSTVSDAKAPRFR